MSSKPKIRTCSVDTKNIIKYTFYMADTDYGQGEIVVEIGGILKERGITPSRLAKLTGLSRPTCYKLMDGDIKRIEFLTLALLVLAVLAFSSLHF